MVKLNAFLIHQISHMLSGNDFIARGQQSEFTFGPQHFCRRRVLRPNAISREPGYCLAHSDAFALRVGAGKCKNVVVNGQGGSHLVSLASKHQNCINYKILLLTSQIRTQRPDFREQHPVQHLAQSAHARLCRRRASRRPAPKLVLRTVGGGVHFCIVVGQLVTQLDHVAVGVAEVN